MPNYYPCKPNTQYCSLRVQSKIIHTDQIQIAHNNNCVTTILVATQFTSTKILKKNKRRS